MFFHTGISGLLFFIKIHFLRITNYPVSNQNTFIGDKLFLQSAFNCYRTDGNIMKFSRK